MVKILFCGNGGRLLKVSIWLLKYCATLNHKNFILGIPAISPVDTSFITAWTNDFGYLDVFSRQIEVLGNADDVLICYSTSGTSKNIVKAITTAKSMNIKAILFTGNINNLEIEKNCDYIFHAPSSAISHLFKKCIPLWVMKYA